MILINSGLLHFYAITDFVKISWSLLINWICFYVDWFVIALGNYGRVYFFEMLRQINDFLGIIPWLILRVLSVWPKWVWLVIKGVKIVVSRLLLQMLVYLMIQISLVLLLLRSPSSIFVGVLTRPIRMRHQTLTVSSQLNHCILSILFLITPNVIIRDICCLNTTWFTTIFIVTHSLILISSFCLRFSFCIPASLILCHLQIDWIVGWGCTLKQIDLIWQIVALKS